MYVFAREIADTRDHTLRNLLTASTACVEAGERLAQLFARTSRDTIAQTGRQWAQWLGAETVAPADFWRVQLPADPARLYDETLGIFNDAYAAMAEAAQSQVHACDQLLVGAIDRAARTAPWEGEIALAMMRNTVQGVESSLDKLSGAIARTSEAAAPPRFGQAAKNSGSAQ